MKLTNALDMFSRSRYFLFCELFSMFNNSDFDPSFVTLYLNVLNDHLNGYDEECAKTYLVTVRFDGYNYDIVELKSDNVDLTKSPALFEQTCKELMCNCCYEIRKISMCKYPYLSVYYEEIEE